MEAKEFLIKSITISLLEIANISPKEIEKLVSKELEDYSVLKMETTMPSTGDGSTTVFLLNKFIEAKMASGMSVKTLYQYRLAIKQLYQITNKELNLVSDRDISHFMAVIRDNGSNNTTIRNKYMLIRSVYSFLRRQKYVNYNPCENVEPPREKPVVKKPLNEKEIEAIKIACESRDGEASERALAMINFMLDTGVRVSEFCGIRLKDVDFDNKSVKVLGKGNKERLVYFTDRTLVRLQKYLRCRKDLVVNGEIVYIENAPLFASTTCKGEKMTPNGIRADMNILAEESGVTRLHPHLLRATFATNLAEKGVGIDIIARLLGHSDLRTVNRYVKMSEEMIKMAIHKVA